MESKSKARITFDIYTLGCKLNQAEQNDIIIKLIEKGYDYRPSCPDPDIYIVNSCTVTARARYKSVNALRRIKAKSPGTKIVLAGCIPQTEAGICFDGSVDLALDNNQKGEIAEKIAGLGLVPAEVNIEKKDVKLRSRANLIIQTGCDSSCSYCIIPRARGKSVSYPLSNIILRLKELLERGYKEIVLTGIHISRWDDCLNRKRRIQSLEFLIKRILEVSGDFRLRLSSIEPGDLDDEFIDFMLSEKRICRHLHIPFQHASDRILRLMKRNYSNDYICRLAGLIRSRSEDIQIGSDFIVGFPSESSEDFNCLYNTVRMLPISHLHIFPFSGRKQTSAYNMEGQLPNSIKKERSLLMRKLAQEKKKAFLLTQLNRVHNIAVLTRKSKYYEVLSDNYIHGFLNSGIGLPLGGLTDASMIEISGEKGIFRL